MAAVFGVGARAPLETLICREFTKNFAKTATCKAHFSSQKARVNEGCCSFHSLLRAQKVHQRSFSRSFTFQTSNHHTDSFRCHSSCMTQPRARHLPTQWSHASGLSLVFHHSHQCNAVHLDRHYSTSQRDSQNATAPSHEPHELVSKEMKTLSQEIRNELETGLPLLKTMSQYYFDGKGKTFRPLVALLMSKACNVHTGVGDRILEAQKTVSKVAEMIHTASLVHDDVIDASDTRRGQSSLNKMYGQRQSILVGDYILSHATIALARTNNPQVISILASVLEDLVSGEFMQLGSKEDEDERFTHYLKKTYKKTASLIANTCKAVAVVAECDEDMIEMAFQYGRNLGIAFQLIDDLLDFVSSETMMGKPTAADLKLGLATAPVLFASQEHPELNPMIMRRFAGDGDVEMARSLVAKSDGVAQTKLLASKHSEEAIKNLQNFADSDSRRALIRVARILLERKN